MKTRYTNAPEDIREAISSAKEIEDFLPSPEKLVPKEETKKITIILSKKSIDFFKQASEESHVPYQQLIRKVLDTYSEHYSK
ncbi:CopG family transcriptional regulator [Marispirochaeta aestuarii]|jgi:predicted DNA binding CopG/RHH family protein|uniref:CopG family transcriptional regulator n=1 Tax=Marispirochaeta aestuarii TaxID=1963862 RepID=A0A1Y1RSP1_9SPIO|nr:MULTISPECIES: CopG family transcriptional regulator [Marispirochaeta]ORC26781.1 CopG family transcriptional regulator [Marispirochaeta aestuarii]